MEITVYVCPYCGEWSDGTANGYPLHTSCERDGHPEAEAVVFANNFTPEVGT